MGGTRRGLGRRRPRWSGFAIPLVVLGAAFAVGAPAAIGEVAPPARHLPHAPPRLIHLGPAGAVYRLSNGRRMILSHTGPAHTGPAQIAGNSFFSIVAWGTITAHGKPFGFSLQASRGPGVDGTDLFLDVGTGRFKSWRRYAFQDHAYDFGDLGPDWLRLPPDLTHGSISTGDLMGPWGDIELSFQATGPPTIRCGGKNVFQKASMTGHFSFTPQSDNGFFGTISSMHLRKATMWVRRGCGGGGGGGGHGRERCPVQPFTVDAMHNTDDTFVDFSGSQLRGRHRASLAVSYQQFLGPVSVWHFIDAATSPSAASLIGGDGARLKGFANAYESGSATLTTSGPPQLDGPYPCGRGRSVLYKTFYGPMSGARGAPLTANFVTGAVSVPPSPDGYDGVLTKARLKG